MRRQRPAVRESATLLLLDGKPDDLIAVIEIIELDVAHVVKSQFGKDVISPIICPWLRCLQNSHRERKHRKYIPFVPVTGPNASTP